VSDQTFMSRARVVEKVLVAAYYDLVSHTPGVRANPSSRQGDRDAIPNFSALARRNYAMARVSVRARQRVEVR
jgi:hypothetical protein